MPRWTRITLCHCRQSIPGRQWEQLMAKITLFTSLMLISISASSAKRVDRADILPRISQFQIDLPTCAFHLVTVTTDDYVCTTYFVCPIISTSLGAGSWRPTASLSTGRSVLLLGSATTDRLPLPPRQRRVPAHYIPTSQVCRCLYLFLKAGKVGSPCTRGFDFAWPT